MTTAKSAAAAKEDPKKAATTTRTPATAAAAAGAAMRMRQSSVSKKPSVNVTSSASTATTAAAAKEKAKVCPRIRSEIVECFRCFVLHYAYPSLVSPRHCQAKTKEEEKKSADEAIAALKATISQVP